MVVRRPPTRATRAAAGDPIDGGAEMRRSTWLSLTLAAAACGKSSPPAEAPAQPAAAAGAPAAADGEQGPAAPAPRPEIYATVRLTADLTALSDRDRQLLAVLIRAARIMDDLFWKNSYGDKAELMARV